MPFADDIRKYTFASLNKLVSKNGEQIAKHPYIPTELQQETMDAFVDAMDLMTAGEKDEEGYVLISSTPNTIIFYILLPLKKPNAMVQPCRFVQPFDSPHQTSNVPLCSRS